MPSNTSCTADTKGERPRSPSDTPTTPVPRQTDAEARTIRLEKYRRESERLIRLRAELLQDGVDEQELEGGAT